MPDDPSDDEICQEAYVQLRRELDDLRASTTTHLASAEGVAREFRRVLARIDTLSHHETKLARENQRLRAELVECRAELAKARTALLEAERASPARGK